MNPKIQLDDETKNFIDFKDESGNKFCINKDDFKNAFSQFQLWLNDNAGTTFSCKLYNLIAQANFKNIGKFLKGFPEETIVYLLWYNSESEKKFLEKWGNIE